MPKEAGNQIYGNAGFAPLSCASVSEVVGGIPFDIYISSMKTDIDSFVRAVCGHWSIESMHWHLDVTFKEDANHTLDKTAAQNHNIIRKWCLSILKPLELMNKKLSMKKKRFVISLSPILFLEQALSN